MIQLFLHYKAWTSKWTEKRFFCIFMSQLLICSWKCFVDMASYYVHPHFNFIRSKRWVINSRREDLLGKSTEQLGKSNVMCANHFEDSQFMNISAKNSLIKTAVPTIFDINNPPKQVSSKRPAPKVRDAPVMTKRKTTTSLEPKISKSKGTLNYYCYNVCWKYYLCHS